MKKSIRFLLLAMGMLFMVSCGKAEDKAKPENGEIGIYYMNKDETRIDMEPYALQSERMDEQVSELLTALGGTPETVGYKPVLSGFDIVLYKIEDGQIRLQVDEQYKNLTAAEEVLTRAALVRTLTQIQGIDYVTMQILDENLTDALGNPIGVMSADMFIDNAGAEINAYEKANLRLYFTNESGIGLTEVMRPVVYNSNISMEKLVLEQLIKGPNNEKMYPTINPDTKIISVTVKDGICYVNLDESFLTQPYHVSSEVTLYSITNSLVELPNVNKVQISINGNYDIVYRESISLTTVLERNLELVGKEE